MGKRATRNKKRAESRSAEFDALKAENLQLKEELERLRLRRAGAHPGANFAEAMEAIDNAGDAADEAVTMYASSMMIRAELQSLLTMLARTITEFDQRLERLDHRAEFPMKALNGFLNGHGDLHGLGELGGLMGRNGHDAEANGHQPLDADIDDLHLDDAVGSNGHRDPEDADIDDLHLDDALADEARGAENRAGPGDAEDTSSRDDSEGITIDLRETRDNTDIEDDAWADDAAEAAAAKGA